jgi:DNA-directed RNA polymerase specialized sigma24 family protein
MRKDDPSEQAHAAIAANSADLLVYLQRRVEVCEDAADLLGETLVRLVHWEGFTLADAAQLINIPAATARGRYARARSLLQVELSAYSSTC